MSTTFAHAEGGVAVGPQRAAGGDVRQGPPSVVRVRAPKLSTADLQRFAKSLEIQLVAGVPIVRALEVQVDEDEPDALSEVVLEVLEDLQGGATFGDALARFDCFPPLFASMVRAGEFSGELPRILRSVSEYLVWLDGIARSIKKALTYPAVVLVACTGLILFILGFLMPSFEPLFEKVGDQLPPSAQVLRVGGAAIAAHWPWIVGGIVGGVVGLVTLARTRPGKVLLQVVVDHAPWVRDVAYEVDVARWMKNLGVMAGSGIPLLQALEMATPAVTTARLRGAVDAIRREIETGTTFQGAFVATGEFSKLANNLVLVGEESGNLPEMFEHIGRHHDERFTERVDRGLKMVEPVITLGLGLVVGGIAVTIIMTIYKAVLLSGR